MPSQSHRLKLEAAAGGLAFAIFLYVGWVRQIEPFYTYYYLFAWFPFLWVVDRTIAARTGQSVFSHPNDLFQLLWLSTTFWLIFEVFNFRLQNWVYTGVPVERPLRWAGYALSFATVMPGVLLVRKLIESFIWGRSKQTNVALRLDRPHWLIGLGALMILLPLLWPTYFFPLIWGGVFFLLDPWVARKGGHSLLMDWKEHRWRQTLTLLGAGAVCGLFWEGCNFGAGSKWQYTLPYWEFAKVFEMPVLGFIGFLPFSLELHAFHQAACLVWKERSPHQRRLLVVGITLLWLIVFNGIDKNTVILWR